MAQLKRSKKVPRVGIVYVHITYNNTIITITDNQGNTLLWHSGGRSQKGARKATGHAAEESAKTAGALALTRGMVEVSVVLRGAGNGRDSAVRGIVNSGLKLIAISDITPDPHGGCRRPKRRRG
jgi:small subunit ribosomal protein S11